MNSLRRVPLLVVLAVLLAVAGVATTLRHPSNPSQLPSGLSVSINAESTAVYCTGLSSTSAGRISFFNAANAPRSLSISVVSSLGKTWSGTVELAAHTGQSIQPGVVDAPIVRHTKSGRVSTVAESYGVAAQISGGGVVADEIQGVASVPCSSQGITRWYATGFNTTLGSDAYVSVYNPTGTEAVLNVSVLGANGFSAPESLQGISVPAHAQEEIDLGRSIVNTANVGIGVKVLRGSLAVVGEEDSLGTPSLSEGVSAPSVDSWFPDVTTANDTTAAIRLANPNNTIASVTVNVSLGNYKIARQTATLAPFTTGVITITPNPAIPVAGYASLSLHSNVPVIAGLATGSGKWIALTAPQAPSGAYVVRDFTGLGFDAASVTNASTHSVTLHVTTFVATSKGEAVTTRGITLGGGASTTLSALISSPLPRPAGTYLVTSSRPSVIVTLTLPSRPHGLYVVVPLDGR
ncbi:MAG: DUF5719 family protein [Acidimicrobiales bacterium]